MVNRTVIITAGGIGKRIGKDIPKQFILLGELPILAHTISVFSHLRPVDRNTRNIAFRVDSILEV